jgi:hypothetical protein
VDEYALIAEREVTAANTFAAGDLVYLGPTTGDNWILADASDPLKLAEGIIKEATGSDYTVFIAKGQVTITSHGLGSAADELYTSSTTPGLATTTPPTTAGHFLQRVAQVLDANTLFFDSEAALWIV